MASLKKNRTTRTAFWTSMILALSACAALFIGESSAESLGRFERTFTPRGVARVTISNVNGNIHVSAWDRKTISVRANSAPSVTIEDQTAGDDITVIVKRDIRLGRSDFEVMVPPDTSLSRKTFMGASEVRGVTESASVNSIDSNVRLVGMNSPTVDAKVT